MRRLPVPLSERYRRTGATAPGADPGAYHGVAMEGYFWRLTDAATGRVVVALAGINRDARGTWANVALATHPDGVLRTALVEVAAADPARLGVDAGPALRADARRLAVRLGSDAWLDVELPAEGAWPRRVGGLGLAGALPGLSQYWHPHRLGGRARGRVGVDGREWALDGAQAYAEKNWGRGGFPPAWWWGQAHGFEREDVCVAFAGGLVELGPVRVPATALVVRLGDELIRLGAPSSLVRTRVDERGWRLRGRGGDVEVEVEAHADGPATHVLPVPLPAQRRTVPGAAQHFAGRLAVRVHRRGRTRWAGETALAGLERGER